MSGKHIQLDTGASKNRRTKEPIPNFCCVENADGIFKATLQQEPQFGGVQRKSASRDRNNAKAFVFSITIFSPKHFRIHWFDDTRTDVECDSVFEGYRQPSKIRRKK